MESELLRTVGARAATFLFSRYITAVSVVILLYDHALNLDKEVKFMWHSSQETVLARFVYFGTRYPTEGVIIYLSYFIGGAHATSLHSCRVYVWVFAMVAVLAVNAMQVAVVLRMYDLWDKRKLVVQILACLFVFSAVATVIFAVLTARQLAGGIVYVHEIGSCFGGGRSTFFVPAILSSMVLFDIIVVMLAVLNALEIPRPGRSQLMVSLHRDGVKIFVLILLRVATLVLSAVGRITFVYVLLPILYSLVSLIHSRITLRVAETRWETRKQFKDSGISLVVSTRSRRSSLERLEDEVASSRNIAIASRMTPVRVRTTDLA
ncbi:hypothetical protein DL96DRAFT_705997 [Flagelloscypha sp. PMI_526]|nr:hypothetical protein DL96DRAFT_705997 [Flagelloscypha sp. PMI_526]